MLIGPWGTNFSEISIEIHTFSFKKIHLKISCGKWCPFCLGLNLIILILDGFLTIALRHDQNGKHGANSNFKCIFFIKNICIMNKIPLNCVPEGSVDQEWGLVLCQITDKLVPEAVMRKIYDATLHHQASMCIKHPTHISMHCFDCSASEWSKTSKRDELLKLKRMIVWLHQYHIWIAKE